MSQDKNTQKTKKLSAKLMGIFLPVIILGVAVIIAVVATFGLNLIKELLFSTMEQHVAADSKEINKQLNSTFYYLNAIADSLEIQEFSDDDEIVAFLDQTLGRYDMIPTGVYLALNDGAYLDPSGWDPGKDVRESAWYKQGMGYDNSYFYYYDIPYFDSDTGDLCATVVRHVHLKDGREGTVASDLMMAASQAYLNDVTVFDTGRAAMITKEGLILSCENSDYCGLTAEETEDNFYKNLSKILTAEDGTVSTFRSGGVTYIAAVYSVEGTDWIIIDYANENDVLSKANTMVITVVAVGIVMLIVIIVLFVTVLGRMIKKPVTELTGNIKSISEGDFTVEVKAEGNDEIAVMNESMQGLVTNIRNAIKNIKDVTQRLDSDSKISQETAGVLSTEAKEQASSMEQILDSMEAMAESVTEVADNATTLATTVAELSEAERVVESNMIELVEKAEIGRKDMSHVSDGMDEIVSSMNDMNNAVRLVDEAAEQINQIVDMINGIAGQTNLLSLNASIEAARAGEAGRGFAVVATEIGQLANNSADATKQIADIISGMTAKVRVLAEKSEYNTKMINESSKAITNAASTFQQITNDLNDASSTMSKMADQMEKVNDVATNMASVSEEQSATSEEVTATINQLTESSKNVATSSSNVSDAAQSVAEAVEQINESVKFFTV